MAQSAQAVAIQVDDGAREVQMPGAAVAGSLVLMHRNGDTAYDFKDNKGQEWEIDLARGDDGYWRVVEIKNIEQLLQKLSNGSTTRPALRSGCITAMFRGPPPAPAFTLRSATATVDVTRGWAPTGLAVF